MAVESNRHPKESNTMNTGSISASATGPEIAEVAEKILEATKNYSPSHILMACLALVMVLQKPEITSEELEVVITDVSTYVVTVLGQNEGVVAN